MYKNHNEIDFFGFTDREINLKNIWRYSNFADFYYRSNNFQHSVRIFYFITHFEKEIKIIFPEIDFRKLQIMALVHDDAEIIIGDFQSGDKLKISKDAILKLESNELEAIKELSNIFPKEIEGYKYRELLEEVFYKNTIISQIVKFFDHLDGFCEPLHEFFSGNKSIVINPVNQYGKIILPFDYYINRFIEPLKYYQLLEKLFNHKFDYYTPFELNFPRWDFENMINIIDFNKEETGYKIYDLWKSIIINNYDKNDTFSLTKFSEGRFYDRDKKIFFN